MRLNGEKSHGNYFCIPRMRVSITPAMGRFVLIPYYTAFLISLNSVQVHVYWEYWYICTCDRTISTCVLGRYMCE